MTTDIAPSGRRYETPVHVRWSDMDIFGHVNHARTVTMLEDARVDWLFETAAQEGAETLKDGVVVAKLDVRYMRSIVYGAAVTVEMWISSLRAASFTIAYDVLADGDCVARAYTQLVPVDPATFRPRRLTTGEHDYFVPFLEASP